MNQSVSIFSGKPFAETPQDFFEMVCPGRGSISQEEWIKVERLPQFYQAIIIWWLWENWVPPAFSNVRTIPNPNVDILIDTIVIGTNSDRVLSLKVSKMIAFFISIDGFSRDTKCPFDESFRVPDPEAFFRSPATCIELIREIELKLGERTRTSPEIPSMANRLIIYYFLGFIRRRDFDEARQIDRSLGKFSGLVQHLVECNKIRWSGISIIEKIERYHASGWDPMMMLEKRIEEDGKLCLQSEKEFFLKELLRLAHGRPFRYSQRLARLVDMAWDYCE